MVTDDDATDTSSWAFSEKQRKGSYDLTKAEYTNLMRHITLDFFMLSYSLSEVVGRKGRSCRVRDTGCQNADLEMKKTDFNP